MDMKSLMRQAQEMQKKMAKAQEELANKIYQGEAGGGMVKVTINGKLDIKEIKIDPSLLTADEAEVIEDLIIVAFTNAKKKAEEDSSGSLESLTGGIPLPPGFKF